MGRILHLCLVLVLGTCQYCSAFQAPSLLLRPANGQCHFFSTRPQQSTSPHLRRGARSNQKRLWCAGAPLRDSVAPQSGPQTQRPVKVIFSDVDGTLLNSDHKLDPCTIEAIQAAIGKGITFVMATGKARGPWVQGLREDLGLTDEGFTINGPGVFIQGLLVCDAEGRPVQELQLNNEAVQQIASFAAAHELALVAYTSGDRILCPHVDARTDVILEYDEPPPTAIGDERMRLLGSSGHPAVYKMILLGEEAQLSALRAQLELEVGGRMAVTKAMDGMLELLPPGTSKATGVEFAMRLLGVEPRHCLVHALLALNPKP